MENSVMLNAVCNEPVSLKVVKEPFYRKGFSPFVNKETGTWWEYDDDKKGFFDTGIIAQGRDGDTVDVRVDGKSIVQDGVANIPMASDEILGAVCARADFGIGINENNGLLYTETASDLAIKNRQSRKVIAPTNFDYAVKCAMTDGIGAEWTADEQAAACERIGAERLGEWEEIVTVTTEEAVSVFTVDKDAGGNPFSLSQIICEFIIPTETASKTRHVYFGLEPDPYKAFSRVPVASSSIVKCGAVAYARIVSGRVICEAGIGSNLPNRYQVGNNMSIFNGYGNFELESFDSITVFTYNDAFPAGCQIIIRGIRK